MQHLIDVRNQLDKYAAPSTVDWHLACINNRWTKRALASAGFGYLTPSNSEAGFERWKPIFSVAEIGGSTSAAEVAQRRDNEEELRRQQTRDAEQARFSKPALEGEDIAHNGADPSNGNFNKDLVSSKAYAKGSSKVAVVHGLDKPLFHIDLSNALESAIANVEARAAIEAKNEGLYI